MSPPDTAVVGPWPQLSDRIAEQLGLHFPPPRHDDLKRRFTAAAREFGYADAAACARWLLDQPWTEARLQVLARHLSIGETHFFRDAAAMQALSTLVLPALVAERRGRRQTLRLWSAACATGEEAYTLSILLHRLLPDVADWDISILATDINAVALEKAEEGVYGEWSFRGAPAWLRPLYFDRLADGRYRVVPKVRALVRFSVLNLVRLPEGLPTAIDVTLCRNALMYFQPPQAAAVVGAIAGCLEPGGWLMLGSAEMPVVSHAGLSIVVFDGASLLRKGAATHGVSNAAASAALGPLPPLPPAVAVASLVPMPLAPDSPPPAPAEPPEPTVPDRARRCADRGQLTEALAWCDQWLQDDKLDAAAHYTRAVVLLEQGRQALALQSLRRAIYLDGHFVLAHFLAGGVASRQGDTSQAHRHFANAQRALGRYAADELLPESQGLRAGDLARTLQALLGVEKAA